MGEVLDGITKGLDVIATIKETGRDATPAARLVQKESQEKSNI
jgi:hypothetical protein